MPELTPAEKKTGKKQFKEFKETGKITCNCNKVFDITDLYKCFYCFIYFCDKCAEKHYGVSRVEFYKKPQD